MNNASTITSLILLFLLSFTLGGCSCALYHISRELSTLSYRLGHKGEQK